MHVRRLVPLVSLARKMIFLPGQVHIFRQYSVYLEILSTELHGFQESLKEAKTEGQILHFHSSLGVYCISHDSNMIYITRMSAFHFRLH